VHKSRTAYWWLRASIPLAVVAVPGIGISFLAGSRGEPWAGPIAIVSVVLLATSIGCVMRSLVVRHKEFSSGYTTLPGFKDRYHFVGRLSREPAETLAHGNMAANADVAREGSGTIRPRTPAKYIALGLVTLALALGAVRLGVFVSEILPFGWIAWPFLLVILLFLVMAVWLIPDAVKASQDLRDAGERDSGRAFLVIDAGPPGSASILGRHEMHCRRPLILMVDAKGMRLWRPGEPTPLMVWGWDQVVSMRADCTETRSGCISLTIREAQSQYEYRLMPRKLPIVELATSAKYATRIVHDIIRYMPV
jgi:hypothetical protein